MAREDKRKRCRCCEAPLAPKKFKRADGLVTLKQLQKLLPKLYRRCWLLRLRKLGVIHAEALTLQGYYLFNLKRVLRDLDIYYHTVDLYELDEDMLNDLSG